MFLKNWRIVPQVSVTWILPSFSLSCDASFFRAYKDNKNCAKSQSKLLVYNVYGHQRRITAADNAMVFQFHKKSSCNFFSRTYNQHYIQLVFYIREVRHSYISTSSMIFYNVKIFKNKSLITKLFQLITIINYSLYMTKTVICGPV